MSFSREKKLEGNIFVLKNYQSLTLSLSPSLSTPPAHPLSLPKPLLGYWGTIDQYALSILKTVDEKGLFIIKTEEKDTS